MVFRAIFLLIFSVLILISQVYAEVDFFVIGDSQIGYNHHLGFEDFFSNLKKYCGDSYPFKSFSFSGYGASGSGFHDWLEPIIDSEKHTRHGQICNMEDGKKWFGQRLGAEFLSNHPYQEPDSYWKDVCTPGVRAIDRVLALGPKVVVASFLGSHQKQFGVEKEQWTREFIFRAIKDFEESVPEGVSCIVLTSPPALDPTKAMTDEQMEELTPSFLSFLKEEIESSKEDLASSIEELRQLGKHDIKGDPDVLYEMELLQHMVDGPKNYKGFMGHIYGKINRWRQEAAQNIHAAVTEGGRCLLVKGHDTDTLENLANNSRNYLDEESSIRFFKGHLFFDTFHLTEEGSLRFFDIKKDEICAAFATAFSSAH